MKIIYLSLLFVVILSADVVVKKNITIYRDDYPNKTTIQLKEVALKKAKLSASKEIFGEFLSSETVVKNGQVVDDIVRQRCGGVIHLKNKPLFKETKDFIKVSIVAYASKKDIEDVKPHNIVIHDFRYSNPSLAIKDLKQAAYDAFIFEAIKKKKPSVRGVKEAKALALNIEIVDEKFDFKTLTYKIDGVVRYIPAYLNSYVSDNHKSFSQTDKKDKTDFYGIWKGFLRDWKHPLLHSNKNATDVNIEITSFSQANIEYTTLDCAADLMIVEKTLNKLVFKEVLTYGKDRCQANKRVILKRLTPKSLEITLENENEKPFHGKVYLEE